MTRAGGVDDRGLIAKVLARPDLFPEQFISWLRRFVSDNSLIHVSAAQGAGSGGGGGVVTHNLCANWSGVLLSVPGLGTTSRVPELAGGSNTWTLTKAYFRCETTGLGTTTAIIEKMTPDANGIWSTATTVATLNITATNYETSATISVAVTTGDLLRVRFSSIGTSGLFTVEATGS